MHGWFGFGQFVILLPDPWCQALTVTEYIEIEPMT